MKKIIFALAFSLFVVTGFAQQISKITLATNGDLESIAVAVDDNVIVNLTDKGTISKFGLEPYNLRTENYGDYTDRLDPYNGRIEYYTANDNPAFSGKVKYIGKTQITYYASYDDEIDYGDVLCGEAMLVSDELKNAEKERRDHLTSIGIGIVRAIPIIGSLYSAVIWYDATHIKKHEELD